MVFEPEIHHRRSIRLKNYDYKQLGIYYITICVQHRICLFGEIVNNRMQLNHAGLMIDKIWQDLPNKFPSVALDYYVIMPNHIHGLLKIQHKSEKSVSHMIQYFKSFTSFQYTLGVKNFNWESFPGKLWQRNYYEHIVRDEDKLTKIRRYILNNPLQWSFDKENPKNINYKAETPI